MTLVRRVYEHRNKLAEGFASKYNITMLMYYETTDNVESAIGSGETAKGVAEAEEDCSDRISQP